MNKNSSRIDFVLFCVVFGLLIAYCFYGAAIGNLYFVGKSGESAFLHGLQAWCLTFFISLLGAGVWVREFSDTSSRYRTKLELLLFLAGFAVLIFGWSYIPHT